MFVRQKKNKSGVLSIQVIDKSPSSYKVLKTIGISSNRVQIDKLIEEARNFFKEIKKLREKYKLSSLSSSSNKTQSGMD
jgi:hypothetical protein